MTIWTVKAKCVPAGAMCASCVPDCVPLENGVSD